MLRDGRIPRKALHTLCVCENAGLALVLAEENLKCVEPHFPPCLTVFVRFPLHVPGWVAQELWGSPVSTKIVTGAVVPGF